MKTNRAWMGPSFEVTPWEMEQIERIVDRAMPLFSGRGATNYDVMTATMDLCACHANGMRMDFPKLLNAPDFDFAHDVFGIRRHIDRTTGKMTGCFVPRCAVHDLAPTR